MSIKRIFSLVVLFYLLFGSAQAAYAGIKVENGDCPVYIANHQMGSQLVQNPNGSLSMHGLIPGFMAQKFPLDAYFRTMTTFVATRKYQTEYATIVLTDSTGKNKLATNDFKMVFEREGAPYVKVSDWKVSFPSAGFYAFNIFVDGTLVGYYPISVTGK